jgi:hypothetical protein
MTYSPDAAGDNIGREGAAERSVKGTMGRPGKGTTERPGKGTMGRPVKERRKGRVRNDGKAG